uniref:Leucine rich repeat containing 71 n=1 Tax=Hippocampus comes TaxID=109280 RepID=A0A3Q2YQR4_HIPCM
TNMARKKPAKEKSEKSSEAEESAPIQTDDYECSGNVMTDFPGLCALLDMKNIPALKTKSSSSNQESATGKHKRRLMKNEILISSWTVDEPIVRVLSKMISALILFSFVCWLVCFAPSPLGMLRIHTPQHDFISPPFFFLDRVITLEGNPLVDNNHHLLFCEGSALTHLNLRNNRIEDEGARLLGAALSTSTCANWNLTSLNLSFNHIGDVGAGHIAKGLRFNRTLLFLSLSNNHIGDSGATKLAAVVADRRELLQTQWVPDRCSVLPHPHSREHKEPREASSADSVALLSRRARQRANCLAQYPRVTLSGEPKEVTCGDVRNHFAAECEPYLKIKEVMALRDPLNKKSEEQPEEEGEGSQCSDG